MPDDRTRLAAQRANPALLTLYRALSRLSSTLTVMNTGAHPDDEQNGLLAAFRFRFGHRVIVACSTRGEGGQNALGPERTGALGVLRTREMEESARVIDADIHWLGHGPDDPVHDFGFSKNGDDTLSRWGEDRIVERLVRAYRTERPDVVIPTFLDVPGQHGHHRAMTRAAETAIALAADPEAFPEHLAEGVAPWRVAKYYLPAWSGGGGTYDDEVPPPNATLTVSVPEPDPATGAAYARIGEWSRAYHASQGMGFWKTTIQTRWPLHLKIGPEGAAAETDLADGVPATLAAIGALEGMDYAARAALEAAEEQIARARAAFPHRDAIGAALVEAARHIETARSALPDAVRDQADHRLARKLAEIDLALLEAGGLTPEMWIEPATLAPGQTGTLFVQPPQGAAMAGVRFTPVAAEGIAVTPAEPEGESLRFSITLAPDCPLTPLYPPRFASQGGNGALHLVVAADLGGRSIAAPVDPDIPLAIRPAASVALDPEALIVRTDDPARAWTVRTRLAGAGAVSLAAETGWRAGPASDGMLEVAAPATLVPGRVTLAATLGGKPAFRATPIAYPHIGETAHLAPEALRVLVLDLALPEDARIAYVGGGADRVGHWLERMGLGVTSLAPGALEGDLSAFTTVVVGIFAFGLRPDLRAAAARLHAFVEGGGHLVTLYHRPSDGWSPEAVPPRPLTIGSPSLRWRVTDPDSEVTVLAPDHPLLRGPNRIGPEDWAGWDKERGLYFASAWDAAYTPLLAMHDAGEAPLDGALLSAEIGKGRHTHTSLALHHQLDRLVPGAFRLMANLVQPAR